MFIAGAFGLGGSGGKDGLFLRRDLSANEFEGNFVEGFLRCGRTIVFVKSTKGKTPAARERFVSCPGTSGFPGGWFG